MKLEESWSLHYCNYGKYPILKGIPPTMSLKQISRCGHLNNERMINLDSISAYVSSANSMTHNALVPVIPASMESCKAIELCLTKPFHGPNILKKLQNPDKIIFKVPDGYGKQIRIQENIIPPLQHIMHK